MNIELTPLEARVIGSLIEKQITTPEQYPLSLNALTSACNQRSNRDPVLDLSESEVQRVVDGLIAARQVSEQSSGYGSRVAKYQQRFCNSDFGLLQFSPQELALVCELLLRGPQTPGELRSRASRLCRFADVGEVESVLDSLARREDGPFVARLPREPGRRESRYTHLFGQHGEEGTIEAQTGEDEAADVADSRLCLLEERVAELEAEVTALRRLLEDLGGKTS